MSSVSPISPVRPGDDQADAPARGAADVELSVVTTVSDDLNAAEALRTYREMLDELGMRYEVVCMVDAASGKTVDALRNLAVDWSNLTIFGRRPWSGEDGELATAYKRARGGLILTLPSWLEVVPEDLPKLFSALKDNDMVVCSRDVKPIGQLRQNVLASSFRLFFGHAISDVFCRVRLSRREVLEEVGVYGVRQHFIPSIAASRGYRVVETEVRNAAPRSGRTHFAFHPVGHLHALLDALALFVVMKFLHRPLRFFGAIGGPIFLLGLVTTLVMVLGRVFMGVSLADRPLLIFGVLSIVLGIQIVALGLVGEIIIFSSTRQMKSYRVGTIIRRNRDGSGVREIPYVEKD